MILFGRFHLILHPTNYTLNEFNVYSLNAQFSLSGMEVRTFAVSFWTVCLPDVATTCGTLPTDTATPRSIGRPDLATLTSVG